MANNFLRGLGIALDTVGTAGLAYGGESRLREREQQDDAMRAYRDWVQQDQWRTPGAADAFFAELVERFPDANLGTVRQTIDRAVRSPAQRQEHLMGQPGSLDWSPVEAATRLSAIGLDPTDRTTQEIRRTGQRVQQPTVDWQTGPEAYLRETQADVQRPGAQAVLDTFPNPIGYEGSPQDVAQARAQVQQSAYQAARPRATGPQNWNRALIGTDLPAAMATGQAGIREGAPTLSQETVTSKSPDMMDFLSRQEAGREAEKAGILRRADIEAELFDKRAKQDFISKWGQSAWDEIQERGVGTSVYESEFEATQNKKNALDLFDAMAPKELEQQSKIIDMETAARMATEGTFAVWQSAPTSTEVDGVQQITMGKKYSVYTTKKQNPETGQWEVVNELVELAGPDGRPLTPGDQLEVFQLIGAMMGQGEEGSGVKVKFPGNGAGPPPGVNLETVDDPLAAFREAMGGSAVATPETEEEEQEEFNVDAASNIDPFQAMQDSPTLGAISGAARAGMEGVADVGSALASIPGRVATWAEDQAAVRELELAVVPKHPITGEDFTGPFNEGPRRKVIEFLATIEDPEEAMAFARKWLTVAGVKAFIRQRDGVK